MGMANSICSKAVDIIRQQKVINVGKYEGWRKYCYLKYVSFYCMKDQKIDNLRYTTIGEITTYPFTKHGREYIGTQFTEKSSLPISTKGFWKVKGNDLGFSIELEKLVKSMSNKDKIGNGLVMCKAVLLVRNEYIVFQVCYQLWNYDWGLCLDYLYSNVWFIYTNSQIFIVITTQSLLIIQLLCFNIATVIILQSYIISSFLISVFYILIP